MLKLSDTSGIMDTLSKYFSDKYESNNFFIYGSYAEYNHGFFVEPKDIDIVLYDVSQSNIEYDKEIYINIPYIPVPINLKAMFVDVIIDEAKRLEPKFFTMSFPTMQYELYTIIEILLDDKQKSEVRHCISNYSSKAYSKGKKKLTVEEDYDEYLGLKNLYHAFKFPLNAIWHYGTCNSLCDIEFMKLKDMWYLHDIRKLIWDTYTTSTGTKEERFKKLDIIIKPFYNTLMTRFRKQFPKDIK